MVKTRTSVRHIAIEKSLDRDQPTFSHFVTSYLLYNFYLNFFKNSLNTWKVKTLANNVQNREITWHSSTKFECHIKYNTMSSINNCIQICSHTQYRYMIIVHISSGKHCVIDVCLYVTYICMYVCMYVCIYM